MLTLNAVDLAFKLGEDADPRLAKRLVMALLRTDPAVVLKAYNDMAMGVSADRFGNVPPETLGQMVALLRGGNKIAAIKAHRLAMSSSLKDAVEATNALQDALLQRDGCLPLSGKRDGF